LPRGRREANQQLVPLRETDRRLPVPSTTPSFKQVLLSLSVRYLPFLRVGRLVGILSLPVQACNLTSSAGSNTPAEEHPLRKFPSLNAGEEENCRNDDNGPLPSDHFVLEDHAVDDGDIKGREDGDEAEDDGPEEELVTANVVNPIWLISHLLKLLVFNLRRVLTSWSANSETYHCVKYFLLPGCMRKKLLLISINS
jgi:hypothetical protein